MEVIFDFLRAALPWIAVGLLLAVFCARSTGKRKKGEQADNYSTEGMCLGMCFGTAIGSSLGNNTGLGITLGMLIGLFVGSCMKKPRRDQDGDGQ